MEEDKRILCCGLVCLDIVTVVRSFPQEDTDQRSIYQYKVRGGNASNSCTVLAELGFSPTFLGTLAVNQTQPISNPNQTLPLSVPNQTLPLTVPGEPTATGQDGSVPPETAHILRSFAESGIRFDDCPRYAGYVCPNSVIILNEQTGSRTIIHTNLGLPELTLSDLERIDLDQFSWVHVEGRNKENVLQILQFLRHQDKVRFSVEVEKVGKGFEEFIPYPDLVFVSKDVSREQGCLNKEDAVKYFLRQVRVGGAVVVAWGEEGAAAATRAEDGAEEIFSSPAFPPSEGVVDTIGAGDTFNGTVLGCVSRGWDLNKSVLTACKVAGLKVGMRGFKGLGGISRTLLEQ